jgi:hypothetical protein
VVFALLDWRLAQIPAVEFDQIEGTGHGGAVVLPVTQ